MSQTQSIRFNGINGATGGYLLELPAKEVAGIATGEPPDPRLVKELKFLNKAMTESHFGVRPGVDPASLEESGWGVIFPAVTDAAAKKAQAAVRDALKPLLDLRRSQAGKVTAQRYKEYAGPDGYRLKGDGGNPESKQAFLARQKMGPGLADPDVVPYYLLLVGSPEEIPYSFQYQLDVQYAVGRLHFDTPQEYADYARSVVASETGKVALPRRAVFFGPANPDDGATGLSYRDLLTPLAEGSKKRAADWDVKLVPSGDSTKAKLGRLLGGDETPALLFTASHGMGFPTGDARQFPHQGGLLCQDWPGPNAWRKEIPPDFYFAADDIPDSAGLTGTIAFHFACYGAGTPRLDDFAHQTFRKPETIAPRAFVARLPQRLLGHPKGGALAAVGHVERAWGYSITWAQAGRQIQAFEDATRALMQGKPVGLALESMNMRYADLSSELSGLLGDIDAGAVVDPFELAGRWTANNDARSYAVIGDPAVRLPLAAANAAPVRPRIETVPVSPPPSFEPPTAAPPAPAAVVVESGTVSLTVPVQITIRLGEVTTAAVAASPAGDSPFAVTIDPDYSNREGYDDEFLGAGRLEVPLPVLSAAQRADAATIRDPDPDADPTELKYHNYSVVMSRVRRLAFFTAVNIDGRSHKRKQLPREKDKWIFDPRVPKSAQCGEDLYKDNPFDRGHLVRRLDPAWGRTAAVAKLANDDTFHFTNCSPQHERFNQGKNLWAGLEDYLLDKAGGERKRMTVFTGPVFEADDPAYRGVKIPKAFWKVAVVARPTGPLALGFVVSQKELLRDVVSFDAAAVAKTFQTSVREVERLSGLSFGALKDAGSVASFAPTAPDRELASLDDIQIVG